VRGRAGSCLLELTVKTSVVLAFLRSSGSTVAVLHENAVRQNIFHASCTVIAHSVSAFLTRNLTVSAVESIGAVAVFEVDGTDLLGVGVVLESVGEVFDLAEDAISSIKTF
jgi:hypothetical protein